ncbi:MAG: serine hydrolase domain-containing protein [Acidobacteriota bacterium]
MRKFLVLLTLPALLYCTAAPETRDDSEGRFAATRAAAQAVVDGGTASATVLFAQRGEVVYEESWGFADVENQIPATPATPYSLASISKPITATALMTLVEEGKVDLDRPANDYLGEPGLVANVGDVADATVRRIANHTAGLPLHYQFFYEGERTPPVRAVTIERYGQLFSAPGERFQYSNMGYGVLDHLVSQVSGLGFADFLRQEVFDPLGLADCSMPDGSALEGAAVRYDGAGNPLAHYDFDHPGASAVYCSARDLAAFGQAQLGFLRAGAEPVLGEASRAEMIRPTSGTDSRGYGVAWRVESAPKATRIGHSGGMPGVRTTLILVPEADATFVVLLNGFGDLQSVSENLLHEALPELFDAPQVTGPDEPSSTDEPPAALPESLAGVWTGTVATPGGEVSLKLELDESRSSAELEGAESQALENPRLDGQGFFRASFQGTLDVEETGGSDELLTVGLELMPDGDRLRGALVLFPGGDSPRAGALSHWTDLRRAGS